MSSCRTERPQPQRRVVQLEHPARVAHSRQPPHQQQCLTPQRQYGRRFWFGRNVPGWRSTNRACWPWVGIDVTGCGCAQFNSIQWRDSAHFQAHVCKCACVGGLKRVLLVQPGYRDMARPHQVGICHHPPHFRRPVMTLARPAAVAHNFALPCRSTHGDSAAEFADGRGR